MLNVCVTHFGDKYSTKYIDNLESGIARNYSGDFNFIVKTNCPNRHWDKISFFETDQRTIVMDIDMLVAGNLDQLFNTDLSSNQLGAFPRWWRDGKSINGGFYIIEPDDRNKLLADTFYSDPEGWIKQYASIVGTYWKGEQTFVQDHCQAIDILPGEWFGVYADGIQHNNQQQHQGMFNALYEAAYDESLVQHNNKFGPNIKLVHFIYDDNDIILTPQWIQDIWNGTSSV